MPTEMMANNHSQPQQSKQILIVMENPPPVILDRGFDHNSGQPPGTCPDQYYDQGRSDGLQVTSTSLCL